MATSTNINVSATQGLNEPEIMSPDALMILLTWITFLSLLIILYKLAFKPILMALQSREDYIRTSLDDADKAKALLANIEQEKQRIIDDAKKEASHILLQARSSAKLLADNIEDQAKKHAQEIITSAHAQVQGERQRVTNELKVHTVNIAIQLAEKVLHKNLNTQSNRELIELAIDKDMKS